MTAPLPLQRCGSCPSQCRPSIVHQLQRWPIPGKHRRELRLRLFRSLHRMSNRKKKRTSNSPMTQSSSCQPTLTIRVGLSGPSSGNTHIIELYFMRLGEVERRYLLLVSRTSCLACIRWCCPSARLSSLYLSLLPSIFTITPSASLHYILLPCLHLLFNF